MRGLAIDKGVQVPGVKGIPNVVAGSGTGPVVEGPVMALVASLGIRSSCSSRGVISPLAGSVQVIPRNPGEALALAHIGTNAVESVKGGLEQLTR
jgi:hypothetical protein